ncbi:MAG: hypothetical protein M3475_00040 [Actinomycetota bacterium]|nr:hypothetical protein [Actinomycetota bacterium]
MRTWMPALGGEVICQEDLTACCARTARSSDESAFECPSCGAMWQATAPVEPEYDVFVESPSEQQGAA